MPLVVRMLPARVVNRSPMLSFAPSTSALQPNATTAAASLLGAPPRARSLGTPFAGVLSSVEAAHPAAKSGASDRSESTGNAGLPHAQNSGHTAGSRPSGSVGTTNPAAAAPVAPAAPPPSQGTERRESRSSTRGDSGDSLAPTQLQSAPRQTTVLGGTNGSEFGIAPDAGAREAQDHSASPGAKPPQTPDATIAQGSATAVESGTAQASPAVPQASPAVPRADSNQIPGLSAALGLAGGTAALPNQSPQRGSSEDRERIVQQITSRLQSPLADSQGKSVPGAVAVSAAGDKSSGQGSNNTSPHSDLPNSGERSGSATPAPNPGHSDGSAGNNQKNQASDSAAAAKAAGLTAVSVNTSPHAPIDASQSGQLTGASAGASAPMRPGGAGLPMPPRPQPLPEELYNSLGNVVQASQLYQRAGGAEMHIAMNTDLLGSIDLRAVVHQSTLTATIGVQRADVQTLLANDLPALQHALSEQSLHVQQISVLGGSVGGRMDHGDHPQQKQNSSAPIASVAATSLAGIRSGSEESQVAANEVGGLGGVGRLSIHV
jgi:hypothetical protein